MLRIGSMNMLLHGVENPDIRYRDSLAQDHAADEEAYTLVLANPPFAGSLDYENTAKDLLQIVKTKKTELLFLALFLRLLKPGGRAAVIVPDGVLFGSQQGAQGAAPLAGGRAEARRRDLAPRRRVQALRGRLHRHPGLHQDQLRRHRPGLVLRRGGRRLEPRRQAHAAPVRRQARPRAAAPRLPPTSTPRTTCPTSWRAGATDAEAATERRNARAPSRASACPRPTSSRRATTFPSTATRKWCTRRSSTARPGRSSPTSPSWRAEIQQGMKELEGMLK